MKIGLNATCFNDRPSGAKQRFVGIYNELIKRLPDSEFIVYEPMDCRVGIWFDGAPNVSTRVTPIHSEGAARRIIDGFRYWDSALRSEMFDIFERFNMPVVNSPTGKTIRTIHDIRGVQIEHGFLKRSVYKALVDKSLRSADLVITVSETMKKEILYSFPGLPISVVPNGCPDSYFEPVPEPMLRAFRQRVALPGELLLAVGHFEKRKNYGQLIDAVALLRERGRHCSLLIIGNDSGERSAVEARVNAASLSDRVLLLSNLSDMEVRCAYALCSLFVFPSLYEGFGIPILEAMAAQRPMILTDIPVFREITQNQGIYFKAGDDHALASAIEHVLSSRSERMRLVGYGNERVRAFSFKNLAAQVEFLYSSLLETRKRPA